MSALNYNAIRLFKVMLARAKEGRQGLTVSAYCNALDIDDRQIIIDSMDRLEKAELIRMDIRGERPALIILREHHKAKDALARPLTLPMAPLNPVKADIEPGALLATYADVVKGIRESTSAILEPLDPIVFEALPPIGENPGTQLKVCEPIVTEVPADRIGLTVWVTDDEYAEITGLLDQHPDPIGLCSFNREIFMAELDRIRTGGMGKHRLSAAVLRAAREDGQPLDQFVTNLIDAGLIAYRAGRSEA